MNVIDPSLTALESPNVDLVPQVAPCLPAPHNPYYQRSPETSQTPLTSTLHYPAHVYDIPFHDDHPGCPTSLDCLPSTSNENPGQTLPILVRAAILGSPQQRLTIRDIYAAIEQRFPYFKTAQENWRGSIRHNLSLNNMFTHIPRPETEPGLGAYWTVNLEIPLSRRGPTSRSQPSLIAPLASSSSPSVVADEAPVVGPSSPVIAEPIREDEFTPSNSARGVKRGRGRGRGRGGGGAGTGSKAKVSTPKRSVPARAASSKKRTYAELAGLFDESDDETANYMPHEEGFISATKDKGKGNATERKGGQPRKTDSSGQLALPHPAKSKDDATIDTLIAELAETHRQFGVATALSMQLADRLTDLQADNARDRAGLRKITEQVEEECRLRKTVEAKLVQLNQRVVELESWRSAIKNGIRIPELGAMENVTGTYRTDEDGDVISQAMSSKPMVMSGEDFSGMTNRNFMRP